MLMVVACFKDQKMRTMLIILALLIPMNVFAADLPGKRCIFAAVQKLPAAIIPTITSNSVEPTSDADFLRYVLDIELAYQDSEKVAEKYLGLNAAIREALQRAALQDERAILERHLLGTFKDVRRLKLTSAVAGEKMTINFLCAQSAKGLQETAFIGISEN